MGGEHLQRYRAPPKNGQNFFLTIVNRQKSDSFGILEILHPYAAFVDHHYRPVKIIFLSRKSTPAHTTPRCRPGVAANPTAAAATLHAIAAQQAEGCLAHLEASGVRLGPRPEEGAADSLNE